jgi:hypothetical protein
MSENEGRIQPGFYRGRAVADGVQYGFTKSGAEQIVIEIEIPAIRRSFSTFLFFSDAAAPFAIERLRACGWTGDDLGNLSGIDRNEIDVQLKYETFEGKERLKCEIATGGGRVKLDNVMDDKQKRAFAARMKGLLKGDAPKPQVRPAADPKRSDARPLGPRDNDAAEPDDDQIPF